MPRFITKKQAETFNLGKKFASNLRGGEVLALYGELGAGKTTFAKGLVNYFLQNKRVLSPTFVIVRHYYPNSKFIKQIVHIDLYRLKNIKEIQNLGLAEFFNNPQIVVLIEWADKMKSLLPENRINIAFKEIENSKRKITYD